MKVVTLNKNRFADACLQLARLSAGMPEKSENSEHSGHSYARGGVPDLIIAIPSGGVYVAEYIRKVFPTADYAELGGRRKGTEEKGRLAWLLRRLPYRITDFLRIREARMLAGCKHEVKAIAADAETVWKIRSARRVLVVDDAVDSGATMAGVIRAVRGLNPYAEVRSAAIVVTTPDAIVKPDYTIYKAETGTLVRFPWSNDFHG